MKDLAIANFNVGKALTTLCRYKEASLHLRKSAAIVKNCKLEDTNFGRRIIQTKKEVLAVSVVVKLDGAQRRHPICAKTKKAQCY